MKKNKGRYKLNIKSYLFFNGNEVKNLIPFEYIVAIAITAVTMPQLLGMCFASNLQLTTL